VPSWEDRNLSFQPNAAFAADERAKTAGIAHDKTQASYTSQDLRDTVLTTLSDTKAEDVVEIDLRGKSSIGDYMVVCSGRSSRQVAALSEKLAEDIKSNFGVSVRMEGRDTGDWVLIDAGDVIVHVFRPEVRAFYQLEKMWLPAPSAAT